MHWNAEEVFGRDITYEMRSKVGHKIFCSCLKSPKGCGKEGVVEFKIGESINKMRDVDMRKLEGRCTEGECREVWELNDVMEMDDGRGPECMKYDVFISHAKQEKVCVAYPLVEELRKYGSRSFLDFEEVSISRSTREQIFEAMHRSKAAVFVLSENFATRPWPIRELKYFLEVWEKARKEGRDGPVLVPLFYKLTANECKEGNLVEEYMKRSHGRVLNNERLQELLTAMEALNELTRFAGVRNDERLDGREFAATAGQRIRGVLNAF